MKVIGSEVGTVTEEKLNGAIRQFNAYNQSKGLCSRLFYKKLPNGEYICYLARQEQIDYGVYQCTLIQGSLSVLYANVVSMSAVLEFNALGGAY